MCGIAGYFGTRNLDPAVLQECLVKMGRRGPDHADLRQWENSAGKRIYLLHSRLNIIDPDERSNQPFVYGSQSLILNGELYNYLEVKEYLQQKGHEFRTASDTEVLLHALSYGPSILEMCEGMWAFAVYDERNGSLLLSRDRFGEKPCYLYRDKSGLYFASEIKFLSTLVGKEFEIDQQMLCRYMINGYKSLYKQGGSFFKGVSELPSAHIMEVTADGKESQRPYWKPVYAPRDSMRYQEAVEGVRQRLINSVKLRLRADVPLAFCMSGGVDSNSLISIAKNVFDYDVHGFTIMNTDGRYQEREMVEHAVGSLGIRHTQVPLEKRDFLHQLRLLIRQHDAPIYTISYYAHWMLMSAIAEHGYRISISGTAADELLTGYYDHHLAYFHEIRHDTGLLQEAQANWTERVKPFVRNPHLSNAELFIEDPSFRQHIFLNAKQFAECFYDDWYEDFEETNYTDSLLRNRMMNEMFHEAVPVILHEDDLNAMFYSIENRSPFLDRDLFEFCYQIPSRHLIKHGLAKAVLRDAMRGIVPETILNNHRKVGFNAPIFSLLDIHDANTKDYLLASGRIYDLVKREKIECLLKKSELANSESKFLFYFVSSKLFLEEFAA